jgi:hypothetical protein
MAASNELLHPAKGYRVAYRSSREGRDAEGAER